MSRIPYFRISAMYGHADGIRWGYARASSVPSRYGGSCLWTYDMLTDRARVFAKVSSSEIDTTELKDPDLQERARVAVRERLALGAAA